MADLRCTIAGIHSPNPFWLASAPPTDKAYNVNRAFEAGWGGVVWKTLGLDPHVVNVSSRYGATSFNGQRIAGLNNIELITDRPLEVNLKEIAQIKRDWPDRALIVSLMVPCNEQDWKSILPRVEDTGADAVELNFGCPHGMSERGMGAAVGQVPEYSCMITEWVKEVARTPVLVKLTPNITDIRAVARAAKRGGADALSAINTINSITGIDLDTFTPRPNVGGASSHGGYCGPAVKPIALHLVQQIASDPEVGLPISGIGGIGNWRDCAEFILLGCGTLQVCTAVMHYGYRIVEDMIDGLSNWMDEKGFRTIDDFRGLTLPKIMDWKHLDLNYKIVARIHEDKCIRCDLCYVACWDGAHQCIHLDGHATPASVESASRSRVTVTPIPKLDPTGAVTVRERPFPRVDETECVGCNLCWLVCPVPGCITMEQVDTGRPSQSWSQRTGQ
jgi:dihydropyrimidine dehydrogenase (NAD+) subunit PreA